MNRFDVTPPPGRFDLELCVSSGQVFRWQRHEDGRWIGVDGTNWYVVRAYGDVPTRRHDALTFVAEDRPSYGSIRYEVRSNAGREAFESLFRLDWDAEEVERRAASLAPELAPYLGALNGLRLMRPSDPTETLFSFLCTPNNNLKRITQMVRALAEYGSPLDTVDGYVLNRFPRTDRIAAIGESELRSRGFGYRAATIPDIARAILSKGGDEWIAALKSVTYDEAIARLVELRGIGPKLADCIALFALHHTEAAPVDTHLWQAVTRLYFPEWRDKPLTDVRYRAVGSLLRSKFGPLTGWAHQFLFFDNLLNWRERR